GFEAYAADDHCLGLFPTPRAAAAAITKARPRDTRVISSATARTRLVSGTPMPQSPLSISLMVTQVTPRRCWSRCKSTPHHLLYRLAAAATEGKMHLADGVGVQRMTRTMDVAAKVSKAQSQALRS